MASVEETSTAVNQISVAIEQVTRNLDHLAGIVQQSATAMDEINSTISNIEQNAAISHEVSSQVKSQADESIAVVSETINALAEIQTSVDMSYDAIKRLTENSTRIENIVNVINEITKYFTDTRYPPVEEIAKDFPKTTFAWGTDVNTFGQPNIYAYTAAAQEGGYVNGVLAAMLTKSKQIGVTGPVEVGDAKTYIDGFVQGVASVDPAIKVNKTWTGSFSDVALMTEAAKTHISAGADILTGSSQSVVGSIGAAKENGKVLWFGTQADQASLAPSLVVASQVYDWTAMIKEIISSRASGVLGGKTYTLQLKNDGLKIAYNSGFTLPADVKAAGDKAIADIKSGAVVVNP